MGKVQWRRVYSIRVHSGIKERFDLTVGAGSSSAATEAAMYLWTKLSAEKRAAFLKDAARFVEKAREVEAAESSSEGDLGVSTGDEP